jgi:hypothetical protein
VLQVGEILQRWPLAGASTGAPAINSLQIDIFLTVSKAVRGHWPLEGSNPSPSAFQAGLGQVPAQARFAAVSRTLTLSPLKSVGVHE